MIKVEENVSLKPFNTFGIEAKSARFIAFKSIRELLDALKLRRSNESLLVLGGGSNILLTQDFDGLVLKNELKGIEVIREDEEHIWIKSMAGESWHQFVLHCIENNWAGVENLSLIPGTVGAAPMQNIGAYGIEIKDVFESLEALEIESQKTKTFTSAECA